MGQLYGKVDQSGEWNDGVLSNLPYGSLRDDPGRKWLILDGPVVPSGLRTEHRA